jgi:hypothetical protein
LMRILAQRQPCQGCKRNWAHSTPNHVGLRRSLADLICNPGAVQASAIRSFHYLRLPFLIPSPPSSAVLTFCSPVRRLLDSPRLFATLPPAHESCSLWSRVSVSVCCCCFPPTAPQPTPEAAEHPTFPYSP